MKFEWIIPLLIGWLAGWIVNYISDVLPYTRQLSKPVCLQCGSPFSLSNYLFFKRCPNGHPRSIRVWFVQILIIALSVYSYFAPPLKIGYWAGVLLMTYFGIVFVIDMEHKLILHPTSIAGALLALALGITTHGLRTTLLGGLGGLIIMLVFYFFGVLFARKRAKRMRDNGLDSDDEESLGQGDVILVTILGFLVGWPLIWFMIILSTLLGGIISLFLIIGMLINRRYNTDALMVFIPYGPYFITGATLIMYFPSFLQALLPV